MLPKSVRVLNGLPELQDKGSVPKSRKQVYLQVKPDEYELAQQALDEKLAIRTSRK